MTALYIIGGISAYLLIGSVVARAVVKIEGKESNAEIVLIIFCWGLVVVLLLIGGVNNVAKRIGGVK